MVDEEKEIMSGILVNTLNRRIKVLEALLVEVEIARGKDILAWERGDSKFDPFKNLREVGKDAVKQ